MDVKVLAPGLGLLVALMLLSGCEDPQARGDASAAQKSLTELKTEIAKLREDMTTTKGNLEALKAGLNRKLADDGEKLKKHMDEIQSGLTAKLTETANEIRTSMSGQFEATRRDFDSRLRRRISGDVAENFQKVRAQIEKNPRQRPIAKAWAV